MFVKVVAPLLGPTLFLPTRDKMEPSNCTTSFRIIDNEMLKLVAVVHK